MAVTDDFWLSGDAMRGGLEIAVDARDFQRLAVENSDMSACAQRDRSLAANAVRNDAIAASAIMDRGCSRRAA